jgi:hypothetical protein
LQAQSVNELTVQEDERKMIWKVLRERALKADEYREADLPELPLDPEILAFFSVFKRGDRPRLSEN